MRTNLVSLLSLLILLAILAAPAAHGRLYQANTPPTPGPITGPASVCLESTVSYSIAPVAGATAYTWAVPANWSIISGQGTRQIVVMAGAVSGHVSVKARNQYGESDDRQFEVTIAGLPARPGAVTGPASVCLGPSVTYQVEAVDGAKAYTWSVPADWAITSGQGTSQIIVSTRPGGGEITVTASNGCGQSAPSSLAVAASAPITGNGIEGSQTVCAGQGPAALSGAAPAGGNGTYTYSWESSLTGAHEGFVPVSGANGQSFAPGGLSKTTWFRRAVNSGACETSYSNVIKLEVIPAITGNSISGDQALCGAGIPAMLAGSTLAGGSEEYVYFWLASTVGPTTGFKAAPGDSLGVNYAPGELTQTTWFRRKVSSGACEATSNVIQIEIKAVPDKPVVEQLSAAELRANAEGEFYEWQRDGVVLTPSTRTISVEEAGAYRVRVRNAAGCFSPYSDVLQLTITGLAEEVRTTGIALHPNPSTGKVNISTAVLLQQVKLQVIDPLGKVVYQRQLPQVQDMVELELSHLPDGVYLLLLNTPDRQRKLRLLLQR